LDEHQIPHFGVEGRQVAGPSAAVDTSLVLPLVPRCRHVRHLTIFVLDESGSVTAHNDPSRPIASRHRETELAIARLGTCRCGNEIASVLFFHPGNVAVGPYPLDRRGQRSLFGAIATRPSSTSSCLDEALEAALELAEAHPDHQVSLAVLSDFELFDPNPSQTLQRFCAFPGERHAVVLQSAVPEILRSDPGIHVTRVTWDSQPGVVARAVVGAMGSSRTVA
jgi:hypothetical protein